MAVEAVFFAIAASFFGQYINYRRFSMPLSRKVA